MNEATNLIGTRQIEKPKLKDLAIQLGVVQREAKELGIPALVLIEGLDASDKGALLNQILLEIDSRAYEVYSTHASHVEPRAYPLLWRFWNHTPSRGRIQFYDRGPYYLILDAWAEQAIREKDLGKYWSHMRNFERQLNDAGVAITKIFLTVPKKEQARRFKKLESNPKTAWRVSSKDWKRHKQYKPYMEQVSEMVKATGSPFACWEVIDTKDTQGAAVKIYQTIIAKLESAIEQKKKEAQKTIETHWIPYSGKSYLSEAKFTQPMDRAASTSRTLKLRQQERIHENLVHEISLEHKSPIVLVYCGWDAAGKGGCIKRLVQGIDPRGYQRDTRSEPLLQLRT
jgi:polyphosphate kinase 2 (PPK2 family)